LDAGMISINVLFPAYAERLTEQSIELCLIPVPEDPTVLRVAVFLDGIEQALIIVDRTTQKATLMTRERSLGSPTFKDFPTTVAMLIMYRIAGKL
jgi:hypothetical protein